jgi:hypothetical protein
MAHKLKTKGRTVADAILRLSQHVHEQYPQAVMTTLEVPCADEDLTIEVALPEGSELRAVSDDLIRTCLAIEDDLGIAILTQVTYKAQNRELYNLLLLINNTKATKETTFIYCSHLVRLRREPRVSTHGGIRPITASVPRADGLPVSPVKHWRQAGYCYPAHYSSRALPRLSRSHPLRALAYRGSYGSSQPTDLSRRAGALGIQPGENARLS